MSDLFVRKADFDASQGVASDLIGIEMEGHALRREDEVLGRGDVFGEEPRFAQRLVVRGFVLLAEFGVDRCREILLFFFAEKVRELVFVAVRKRIGVAFGAVHSVGAAQVTPAVDDARQKGVGDGNFAVDRVFIGMALFGNILKVFGCDFAQGCLSGLFGCSRESLQQEKIADVRLFDRFEGGEAAALRIVAKRYSTLQARPLLLMSVSMAVVPRSGRTGRFVQEPTARSAAARNREMRIFMAERILSQVKIVKKWVWRAFCEKKRSFRRKILQI